MSDAPRPPATLGVVGAGTMGAGIAELGCAAGLTVLLHDPLPGALERGAARVRERLARLPGGRGAGATAALRPAPELERLAPCELVIEAAPERLELKRDLFARLSGVCPASTVLATNTSSIPVTALAGAAARPENVVGMHFFNPAPVMRLVELVAAEDTGERALALARATGEAMGKRVIVAADGPGFLVNRCARPFAGEALRLVQEGVAGPEQVDRICRIGGGFPMGPFELMDLVGNDVSLDVSRSFAEGSFGEPRWRPSPRQARLVAAGRLGRKSGRGWYAYGASPHRAPDPEPPAPGGGGGRPVAVLGGGPVARRLRELAAAAGYVAGDGSEPRPDALVVDAAAPAAERSDPATLAVLCAERSLAASGSPAACGFNIVPPLDEPRLVELTRTPLTPPAVAAAGERFFASLGMHVEWVGDAPGLVLGRIVPQLVNEAAFAIGEGVGAPADVDAGLTLGLNHPRGPVAWGEAIGLEAVLRAIEGLWEERREERYRAAPLLRRAAALGTGLSA